MKPKPGSHQDTSRLAAKIAMLRRDAEFTDLQSVGRRAHITRLKAEATLSQKAKNILEILEMEEKHAQEVIASKKRLADGLERYANLR